MPCARGGGVDVGEQRLHAVQMVDRIDLGLAALAAVEHGASPAARGPRRRARWRAGRIPARRRRPDAGPLRRKHSTCRASAWRGSEVIGAPSRWYIDISTWPRAGCGAVQRLQRAGDRPAAQVAVAGIPDQAGLVDILAGDVEAEDRDRQMPAALVEASKLVAADDLAAADAVGVGEHDVEGLDVGMGVEKGLGFVDGRTGGRSHDAPELGCRPLLSRRELRRNIAEGRDQAVDLARSSVAGETSIMLWNGAISTPRLTSATWIAASRRRMRGFRLAAVPQRARRADELDARADARDMPGQPVCGRWPRRSPASSRARQPLHMGVVLVGHHLFQRGAHGGELQRIGRQRRAHAGIARFLVLHCRRA